MSVKHNRASLNQVFRDALIKYKTNKIGYSYHNKVTVNSDVARIFDGGVNILYVEINKKIISFKRNVVMKKNRILRLLASLIMFCSGIMMIIYQFNDKDEYMFIGSIGIAIFGLILIFSNLTGKK